MESLAPLLKQATEHFKNTEFAQAETLCIKILGVTSQQAPALHLLSKVFSQQGKTREATALALEAATQVPDNVEYQFNCGTLLLRQKMYTLAQTCLEAARLLAPKRAEIHVNLGIAFQAQGNLQEALRAYASAIAIAPNLHQAYLCQGNVYQAMGRLHKALNSYNQALCLQKDSAETWVNRGNLLQELGDYTQAIENYQEALQLHPDLAEAHANLGNALLAQNRAADAEQAYRQALRLKPEYADACCNLGNTLRQLGRLHEAMACYNRVLAITPTHFLGLFNRGSLFLVQGNYQQAHTDLYLALEQHPNSTEVLVNLGNALRGLDKQEDALRLLDRAIRLSPNLAEAYFNRANALADLEQWEASIASLNQAILHRPDYAEAQWNKSLILLKTGRFEEGWPLYEWRWSMLPPALFEPDIPLWDGRTAISGKTILILCEQGLGDAIQFCRYIPMLADLGARIILEVPATLRNLFTTLSGISVLLERGDPPPSCNLQFPLMSLPRVFNTRLESIPRQGPYLEVPKSFSGYAQKILGMRHTRRVGLIWRGGTDDHGCDRGRSLELEQLLRYLPDTYEYICLQQILSIKDRELLALQQRIRFIGDQLPDLAATAALCEQMDLVISIDTAVAHLAGALGKPVWLLLPHRADWRWLTNRTDSPWYPSMQLFRQEQQGDWTPVLVQLRQNLIASEKLLPQ